MKAITGVHLLQDQKRHCIVTPHKNSIKMDYIKTLSAPSNYHENSITSSTSNPQRFMTQKAPSAQIIQLCYMLENKSINCFLKFNQREHATSKDHQPTPEKEKRKKITQIVYIFPSSNNIFPTRHNNWCYLILKSYRISTSSSVFFFHEVQFTIDHLIASFIIMLNQVRKLQC